MTDMNMIKEIVTAYGPSGREDIVTEVLKSYVEPLVDEVYTDTLGNLIAHKKGTSGKKLMFVAHMDQIGLIVTDIDEKGFLRVANIGGVNPAMYAARVVRFENGLRGVTHFETQDSGFMNPAKNVIGSLFIDIGAESREEAMAQVSLGDMAVVEGEFLDFGKRISCAAMDDRICCAALVEALKGMESDHDIYAVFSVQEEVGVRGAGAAAYAIQPDLCINLDVTLYGDTPKCIPMAMKLGAGAAIKVMDASVLVPPVVYTWLEKVADDHGIQHQRDVMRMGGTDTSAVQKTRGGVLVGGVSIPLRYMHSPVEMADKADFAATAALLRAVACEKGLPTR